MKMQFNLGWFVILFVGLFGVQLVSADSFDVLSARFSGVSQSLHAAAFGNGVYVAVGDGGTIVSSADSVTWIPHASGTTNRLNGVKYGANGFVAVGDASTILTSTDGTAWVHCASPVSNKLSAVTYGAGRYVAVGSSGIIVTSTNGVSWSSINTGAPYNFNGVDYMSMFVLVGDSGTIMTSSDGLAWTLRFSGTFSRLNAVSLAHSLNNGGFFMVAVGDSGTLDTSSDGVNWTVASSGTSADLFAVANDALVGSPLFGYNILPHFGIVGAGGVIVTGATNNWQAQVNGSATNLNGILYARGNFLAVGDSGLIAAGIPWLPRDPGTAQPLNAVSFGGGSFIAVGGSGTGPGDSSSIILRSTNGKDWTTVYTGTNYRLSGATYGINGYVAVDYLGTVLTSSNGWNWTSQTISAPYTSFSGGVAYGNGFYVVTASVGVNFPYSSGGPVAYRSTDGLNWTGPYALPSGQNFPGIAFGNNIFVAVDNSSGAIVTSPDGINWTARASPGPSLNAVGFWNGRFVAVGGGVVASSDGTNWTGISNGPIAGAIAFGNQGFVTLYNAGAALVDMATSPDGTNWTTRGFDGPVNGVAFGNNTYVLVGSGISQIVPTNSQAMPLLSGQMVDQGFKLSALSQPSYSYHIQSCTNLASSNWLDIYSYTSTQAVTVVTDSVPIGRSQGYYRIVTP